MRRVAAGSAVWIGALLAALAAPAALAQTPDSTATPAPADTTEAPPGDVLATPPDSLGDRALPGAPLLFADPAGRPVTPVPAVTASLSLADLLTEAEVGAAPTAFDYRLGAPGRSAGVALDGLDPHAPALTLDGRPIEDLVTGAPRLDFLPLALVGPLRWAEGGRGRAAALETDLRDVRLSVPVTELRYFGGQNGVRHASGTHAQTRRPPAFLRRTDADRLTATFHAANRTADAVLAGGQLRHTEAVGRLLLTRPGLAVETGVLYTDRTEGARLGVVAAGGTADVFGASAQVLVLGATRQTKRLDGWARARLRLLGAPTALGVSVEEQRRAYVLSGDTTRVVSPRLSAFAERALLGPDRLQTRLQLTYDPAVSDGLFSADARLGLHAAVSDSLRLGPARLTAEAGAHAVGPAVWPSGSVRVALGPAAAGVRLGGRAPSRLETSLGADDGPEQTVTADASLAFAVGDWRVGGRAFASATHDGRWLVSVGDSAVAVGRSDGAVVQGGAALGAGWREAARRGFYARLNGVAQVVTSDGGVADRLAEAVPRLRGSARLGVRAEGVGDGVLDLDLAAVGRGWTALRSRRVDPVTGALALPDPASALGIELPSRETLGLEATATFSERASLFVRYDHALGGRLYDGAIVTQGEPLAPHVLRFGVFWALLN